MTLNSNLKNILLVIFTTLILSACSTAKKSGDIDGDVYTGKLVVQPGAVFNVTCTMGNGKPAGASKSAASSKNEKLGESAKANSAR